MIITITIRKAMKITIASIHFISKNVKCIKNLKKI